MDSGETAGTGSPAALGNLVRSTSCRRTISPRAAANALRSSAPASRTAAGML